MKILENALKYGFYLVVLIVCVTFYHKWQGHVEQQNEAREAIQKTLDEGFAHIEERNGSALMLPGNATPAFQTDSTQSYKEVWRDTKLVPVGFKFYQEDTHYKVEYEIETVKSSDVEIHYDYKGSAPSRAGEFTGTVDIKDR